MPSRMLARNGCARVRGARDGSPAPDPAVGARQIPANLGATGIAVTASAPISGVAPGLQRRGADDGGGEVSGIRTAATDGSARQAASANAVNVGPAMTPRARPSRRAQRRPPPRPLHVVPVDGGGHRDGEPDRAVRVTCPDHGVGEEVLGPLGHSIASSRRSTQSAVGTRRVRRDPCDSREAAARSRKRLSRTSPRRVSTQAASVPTGWMVCRWAPASSSRRGSVRC